MYIAIGYQKVMEYFLLFRYGITDVTSDSDSAN